ncbi:MAG: hypothetical protein QOF76_5085, partial [Solirubrobacteraceae bacterium]|nr:hypothetical protein [Solirubrobacteraceae bacterium]
MPKPSRKILASVVGVAVAVIGVGGSAQAARQDFPGGSNQGSPFTVPQDVTQVTFQATGAQGGGDSPGKGGRATATYNVVPGQKFQVTVGGVGQDYSVSNVGGGFNGGGTGGNGSPGGGGMSDVRKNDNGCAAVFPPACGTGSIIIVGGGGGGGGGSNGATATLPGGTGGDPNGGNGTGALPISGGGGGGATQVSGGAGGGAGSTGNQPSAGAAGAAFTGGAGAKASQCAGAGGGAGVFGGGGGGSSSNQCGGGGGGSSSFTLNGALTGSSGFYQRDVPPSSAAFGDVLVTYVTPTGGTTTVGSGVPSTVAFGAPVSQSVTVSSALSNGAPSGPVDFYVCGPSAGSCTSGGTLFVEKTLGQPQPGANSTATSSGGYTATQPGTYCFRAQYLGDAFYNDSFDGDDCFTVNRFDPTTAIAPSASSVNLGGSLTAKATLTGNASGGAPTGAVSFFLCTPAQVASGCPGSSGTQIGSAVNLSASGNAASADSASFTPSSGTGQYCVRFSYPGNSFYNPAANTGSAGCFTVNKGSTTAASAPGSSSIVLGAQNHDT